MLSIVAHPQMDGQTKVVNRTLSTLSCALIQKNFKKWKKYLPHIKFTYNRSIHFIISFSHFKVVYGFNPLTLVDILLLSTNFDSKRKVDFVRDLHVKVWAKIEKKNKQYAK